MRKLLPSILFLLLIAIFSACKKTDSVQEKIVPATDRFFTVPTDAPKQIKAVAQALEKQNERHNYLSSVTKKQVIQYGTKQEL